MKRLLLTGLCVSVFFLGLGSLVDGVGAKFKSDERALELIAKARVAIGGDAAIANVHSMRIVGRTTRTVKIDGTERSESGETEIAMQLPDKLMKMVKLGDGGAKAGDKRIFDHEINVIKMGEPGEKAVKKVRVPSTDGANAQTSKKIVIKKDDGTTQTMTGAEADDWIAAHPNVPAKKEVIIKHAGDGEARSFTMHDRKELSTERKGDSYSKARQNELLRTTLGLLLTAPQGMDVIYTYKGESSVDGVACNVVNADFGGQTFTLFLSRSSSLPVAMNYTATRMPKIMTFSSADKSTEEQKEIVIVRGGGEMEGKEMAEFQVRFSDYRQVGGVQFPHNWTNYSSGKIVDTFDVTTYEINPANIAEKFENQRGFVRTTK